jgi:transcription antitermination factor NusG
LRAARRFVNGAGLGAPAKNGLGYRAKIAFSTELWKIAPVSQRDPNNSAEPRWYVAHTRPRCEKKFALYCKREELSFTLPCYQSVRKYRGKTVIFRKPLFPNYVFLEISPADRPRVYQNDLVANLLDVPDQAQFDRQLHDILLALTSGMEVRLAPQITPGARVRIKFGPLRGLEADVQRRSGILSVLLRLDFIGQAAAVQMDADHLELL